MKTDELDTLLREKDSPCISIIIPTERTARKKNYEVLKKAIQTADAILKSKPYPENIKASLLLKINETGKKLPASIQDGLGFYISAKHSFVISFPFSVIQKIIVDESFETRELFYLRQFLTPYYVMMLGNRSVHLYKAIMDSLEEIKDGNFPVLLDDQYEYARPSVDSGSSNSLKSFEKDKTVISAIRMKTMLKNADSHLAPYLSKGTAKIILAGTQKPLSAFTALTNFSKQIFGKVPGSFKPENPYSLGKAAWLVYVNHRKNEDEQSILKMMEQPNEVLAEGLPEAWSAAREGKGLLLAVEKDFHCRAYEVPNQYKILLQPPKKPYTIIPDAVDDLIETVSKKNGKIIFVENEQLKNSGHVTLLMRY